MVERRASGEPLCVLDTKYKRGGKTSPADLQQIVAYAVAKGCVRGVLCYPREETGIVTRWSIGGIEVRRLAFGLDGDLEAGGGAFLEGLLGVVG